MNSISITDTGKNRPDGNIQQLTMEPTRLSLPPSSENPEYPAPLGQYKVHTQLRYRDGEKYWQIHEVTKDSALRPQTEAIIQKQYRTIHSADISEFLPNLFTISDESIMWGAVGLKCFDHRIGLVEQYLDAPVETAIGHYTGITPERSRVVEVGNLAAATLHAAIRLIAFLCHEAHSREFEYAIFTGIKSVRVALQRLRINYFEMQPADPVRLHTDKESWGSYYENDPRVMVVNVADAAAAIALIFCIERGI